MIVDGMDTTVFTGDTSVSRFLSRWDRDMPPERRTYGVKICLATAEAKTFRDGLYRVGVRHILASYLYMRNWLKKSSLEEIERDLGRFDFVALDSGGFTLLKEKQEHPEQALKMDVKAYAEEYYTELQRIGHLFSICMEVDVPSELGIDYSEAKKKELLSGGIPIVPVIQPQPLEHYRKLGWFKTYPYIAVGSAVLNLAEYNGWVSDLYREGQESGVLFHGLGVTSDEVLLRGKFYSVDSSTWINGGKFGTTMLFENGKIRFYSCEKKSVRRKHKRMLQESGINFDDIVSDKAFEVNMMNAVAWRQMGDSLKYDVRNSYWLSPEEREAATKIRESIYNANGLISRDKSVIRAKLRRSNIHKDSRYDDRVHEPLHCDSCYFTGRCPRYAAGSECGFDFNLQIETESDLHKVMKVMLEATYGRVMQGILFEKLHGGTLDKTVSNELKVFAKMIKDFRSVYEPRKIVLSDEEELQNQSFSITGKASSKGLLSQMLASVLKDEDKPSDDDHGDLIDVTSEPIEE